MSRTLSVAALAASLSIVLAACGSKAPATAGDAGPSSTPDASAAPSDAQQQLTAKLNAYIGCFNTLDSKTHGSIESYTRWIRTSRPARPGARPRCTVRSRSATTT